MNTFLLLSFSSLFGSNFFMEEVAIETTQLPTNALEFIEKHYPNEKISIAILDKELFKKEYQALLTSGTMIEFDKNGNWVNIECKHPNMVPEAILPKQIIDYVDSRFANNAIVQAEKDGKNIEIQLDNNIELEFNKNNILTNVDN